MATRRVVPRLKPNFKEKDCGFTLVEILLVLVLLVVIASFAVPNFGNSFNTLKLQTTANDIAYLMRYAQSRAIIKGQEVRFTFDDNFTAYRLQQISDIIPDINPEPVSKEGGVVEYESVGGRWGRTFKVPENINIESASSKVDFYPDGQIEEANITVCCRDKCIKISTEERRGRVQVYELQQE